MSTPTKHHYLPRFFLRRWADSAGKMSEYKRPHGKLICARKYPAQTGYRKDLYTNESASDPAERQALEVRFLQKVDDGAAQALDFLEQHACKPTDAFLRNAWSRFLMSLMHRSPQRVEYFNDTVAQQSADILIPYLREKYDEHRGPSDPTRFEDWLEKQNSFAPELRTRLLKGMIDSKLIGNTLNLMHWRTYILQHPRFGFLTGDSPLIMSNGVGHRRSFVVVAISPFRLFIAAHDSLTISKRLRTKGQIRLNTH